MITASSVMFILLPAGKGLFKVQVKPVFLRPFPLSKFLFGVQAEISERKEFCLFRVYCFARARPAYTSRE